MHEILHSAQKVDRQTTIRRLLLCKATIVSCFFFFISATSTFFFSSVFCDFLCDVLCILNSWSCPRIVPPIQLAQIPWASALRHDVIYVILMTFSIVLKCHPTWLTMCVWEPCQRLFSMHIPTSFCPFKVALCHVINNSKSGKFDLFCSIEKFTELQDGNAFLRCIQLQFCTLPWAVNDISPALNTQFNQVSVEVFSI